MNHVHIHASLLRPCEICASLFMHANFDIWCWHRPLAAFPLGMWGTVRCRRGEEKVRVCGGLLTEETYAAMRQQAHLVLHGDGTSH